MRTALHPERDESITVPTYWEEFGHRPLLEKDTRLRARCPFCPQKLNDVAGKSGHTVAHFAHFANSEPCASKAPAGRPYYTLTPVDPDPEHARLLRGAFYAYWDVYYRKLEELVPCLSKDEFLALVAEANRLRVWEYRHLEKWEIPYVFVLMTDFPAFNSTRKKDGKPRRVYWFRFWYDASVQAADDLWIRRMDEPILYRASFVQPRRRGVIPKYDDLVRFYPIDRDREYLGRSDYEEVPDWLYNQIDAKLFRMLEF